MTQVEIRRQGESPFDQIMEFDTDGTPIWRARRLMSLMGYPRWADFRRVLERAMTAAKNTEMIVYEVFRGSPENPGEKGGRPREDFKLTRDAAYLTALNGDPNKEEVAGAQRYFVEQTKKQEAADRLSDQPRFAIAAESEAERRALVARLDLSVIDAMGGIVDPKWRESLARHTWATYKGEKPEIAAEDRLLMVQPYLVERGVSKADIASIGSVFGKRVKAAYVAKYNREPDEVPALVNGRERPVKGYYERDRFLFDAVFDEHYSHLVGPQQLELGAA